MSSAIAKAVQQSQKAKPFVSDGLLAALGGGAGVLGALSIPGLLGAYTASKYIGMPANLPESLEGIGKGVGHGVEDAGHAVGLLDEGADPEEVEALKDHTQEIKDSIRANAAGGFLAPYGALAGGAGGMAAGAMKGRLGLVTGLLGALAGGGGSYAAGRGLSSLFDGRDKEARIIKKASLAIDGMQKEAMAGKASAWMVDKLQRLGVLKTSIRESTARQSFWNKIPHMINRGAREGIGKPIVDGMANVTAVPAGIAGAVLGSASAPEGKGFERALSTGGGLAAAVLGARGGSKWLHHLASKQGLSRKGTNIPHKGMLGLAGGGAAAGLGTSEAIKAILDQMAS